MTRPTARAADKRLEALEHDARIRRSAELAGMTDAELAAASAGLPPAVRAWLEALTDEELQAINDDTPAGRALLASAPDGAL